MAKWIIDRFEGDLAVLEGEAGELVHPRADLPIDAKEGDVLTEDFMLDIEETAERLHRIQERFERLKKK